MIDPKQMEVAVREEFRTLACARQHFPMLTDWGVADFSVTIHSLGCNYLSELGRHLGYWAISEYPVKVSQKPSGHSVRPDVVWWSRPGTNVALAGEFERFAPGDASKILCKAQNLLRVYHELDRTPTILLLMVWAMAGTDLGELSSIRAIGCNGFRTSDGLAIPGLEVTSRFMLAAAVFGTEGGAHRLQGVYV